MESIQYLLFITPLCTIQMNSTKKSEREPLLESVIEVPDTLNRRRYRPSDQSIAIQDTPNHNRKPRNIDWIYKLLFTTSFILLLALFLYSSYFKSSHFTPSRITKHTFNAGVSQCLRIRSIPTLKPALPRTSNPRYSIKSNHLAMPVFLLQHATLLNGNGKIQPNTDIFVMHGQIKNVSSNLNINQLAEYYALDADYIHIIDIKNNYITPGLVDMHSHAGTDSWPNLDASDDTNEMTSSPTTPYLRSIDGFNPKDPAIEIINAGGVTSSLILPGSGNLIGGEAFVVKHRKVSSNRVGDMKLYAEASEKSDGLLWSHIKMACGENAKDVYGSKGMMPGSR